jgi:prepilin-type N-terminal cleavage/methylation domain-containing protein
MNLTLSQRSWTQSRNRTLVNSSRRYDNSGFTIVELLVVIVVIGILAAIAIVSYSGISQKARAVSLQSDLNNSITLIKAFQVSNSAYPGSISDCPNPAANNLCLKYSSGNTYVGYTVNNQTNPQTFLLIEGNGSLAYKITNDTAMTQLASTIQPNVTPGAILEFRGVKANGGASQGINGPLTTPWFDTSGNGNSGTLNNVAGNTSDGWAGSGTAIDPYALVFNGTSAYVSPPSLAISSGTFTFEAWIKYTSTASGLNIISEGNSGGSNPFSQLNTGVGGSDGEIRIQMRNNAGAATSVQSTANYNDNNWHHAVGCYDGTNMHLYIDGAEVGTPVAAPAGPYTMNQTRIGTRGYTTPSFYFAGSMSVARIYPFALSATQAAANFAAGPNN